MKSTPSEFFCPFPLHSMIECVSKTFCAQLCLEIKGCKSFNFRPTAGSPVVGDCVIVAPSDGLDINIASLNETGWLYYADTGS